ncbi:MAG: translation initiation factor IF-2 subunit alpha [Candidatus Thermoplasmatota archaeon]
MKKKEWPEEGEFVLCTVKEVKGFGAFVTLDEYDDKEGLIHISEIATGWVKQIRNHVKEGQKVVSKVLEVEKHKGHINLTLKRVNEHQKREKIQEWKNNRKATKLFEMLSKKLGKGVKEAYGEFGDKLIEKYGTLYGAFEEAAYNIETLKKDGFKGDWLEEFEKIAEENITIPFVDIKGYVEIKCWRPDGIKHIREALSRSENTEYEDVEIKAKYNGAPQYMITVKAPDYKIAEDELKKSTGKIKEYIEKNDGEFFYHRELKK